MIDQRLRYGVDSRMVKVLINEGIAVPSIFFSSFPCMLCCTFLIHIVENMQPILSV